MPFRRRFKRRRTFKRRRGSGTRRLAKRALRGVKRLNRYIETKHVDNQNLAGTITNVATAIVLNDIVQGNSGITRIGDRLHIKSVTFKGIFNISLSSGQADATVHYPKIRFILVIDRQPNGATPNLTDILSVSANTVPGTEFYHGRDWAKRSRFKILKEKIIRFPQLSTQLLAAAGTTTGRIHEPYGEKLWRFHHRFRGSGLRTDYFGNAGTIADITKNTLLLVYFSNTTAGDAAINMTNWQRITFKDA